MCAEASRNPSGRAVSSMSEALRWSVGPTLVLTGLLSILLVMALLARWAPITRPGALPDDPDVRIARDLLGGQLPLASRGLVLVTVFAGESPQTAAESLPFERLSAAHARLAIAARRHPHDARLAATLTHLELASLRYEKAERDYRALLDTTPHDGESRLGLGIALAMRADWAGPGAATEAGRALLLQAIAQFANVDRDDPAYWAAVYDRAVLLPVVARGAESRALLAAAIAQGAPEAWAGRYRGLTLERRR
jgi:tetratricopeptide (TPR) repeat protein